MDTRGSFLSFYKNNARKKKKKNFVLLFFFSSFVELRKIKNQQNLSEAYSIAILIE